MGETLNPLRDREADKLRHAQRNGRWTVPGLDTRAVMEDITESLCGARVSSGTVSNLNKKVSWYGRHRC